MSKRQHDRRARRAEDATQAATANVAVAAGSAATRAAGLFARAGSALEEHGRASAPAVGAAVGTAVGTALVGAETARAEAGRFGNAASTAVRGFAAELVDTVQGLAEEPGVRGAAAFDALRGAPIGPPAGRRRWPWAMAAAVLGASAGVAVAVVLRRWGGTDAPDAQEPHELRAVVDVADASGSPARAATPPTPASPA